MKYDVYVASSWRNTVQPWVVQQLRAVGLKVYDFRNPRPGNNGFHWSEIDPDWMTWSTRKFRQALLHPLAQDGFALDMGAMRESRSCVLVLPCGRSAHLEAGWFVGEGRPLYVFSAEPLEPELMYSMATVVTDYFEEIEARLIEGGEI